MRFRALALTASLAIAGSASAYAQTSTTVKITGAYVGSAGVLSGSAPAGAYPAGTPNFYVSPYAGLIDYNSATNTGTGVSLNCVDYFHHVSIGEVWTAAVTNLGAASSNLSLLSNTRYGNLGGATASTLELYKQAAWLTLQYGADPAASPDQTRAIQSAIWSLFNGLQPGAPTYDGPGASDSQVWYDRSKDYTNWNKLTTADLQGFSVLTDNTNPWAADSKQEFLIHTTPEPGTILLMLTGMAVLVIVMRRRRPASTLESA